MTPRTCASPGALDGLRSQSPLVSDAHRQSVQAVIDQVLFAAQRLFP
ncbi:MAG: hypothetical protein ACYCZ6_02950 [Polaromonas sp.]